MIVLTIPIRTASKSNARGHWAGRHARTRAERRATRVAYLSAGRPDLPRPAVVRMIRIAPRALDDDNLRDALKAIRDELADILGLPNDRHPDVTWSYAQERGGAKEYAVRVEIEPVVTGTAGPRAHELKTWPPFWAAVEREHKSFEVRWNDRDFRVGDVLVLREWDPSAAQYTSRECTRVVKYVLSEAAGLAAGYVVLAIEPIHPVAGTLEGEAVRSHLRWHQQDALRLVGCLGVDEPWRLAQVIVEASAAQMYALRELLVEHVDLRSAARRMVEASDAGREVIGRVLDTVFRDATALTPQAPNPFAIGRARRLWQASAPVFAERAEASRALRELLCLDSAEVDHV